MSDSNCMNSLTWNGVARRWFGACAMAVASLLAAVPVLGAETNRISLDLNPRVCTMSRDAEECEALVRAHWRSDRNESLCLVIIGRPDVKRCWEDFAEGRYSIELSFAQDLTVQLRDPTLEKVLASEVIAIIRQAIQLRRKRKQPWNILY
jgi:hypothetical protein